MASTTYAATKRTSKIKQACDACHLRKVRCDGDKPCANCLGTDLQCTYLAVPKKKGPKGKRTAKNPGPKPTNLPYLLNQIPRPVPPPRDQSFGVKETLGFNAGSLPRQPEPVPAQTIHLQPPVHLGVVEDARAQEKSAFRPSSIVTKDLLKTCLDAFFTHKYPIMPILDQEAVYLTLSVIGDNPEQYALMTALCSVIVLQPEILKSATGEGQPDQMRAISWPSSEFLMKETLRARQFCDHFETLFCLGKDNSAWFYIRESMTMLQILRLHEENAYSNCSGIQYATYCRRTFWLLFITERAYALQRHRPLTLQRTINLPTVDPGPEATILSGFLDLVSLFQNFDDTFLSLWNLSETDSPAPTQSLVQLQDILKFAIPNVSERTEIQQADLLVSRQWLKTMVWQLCVRKGLLSSASTNESMSFHYPVTIARDVVLVSRLLPPKAFEANGVGILEKVFDIGCSLADVLSLHPNFANISALEVGPRDYLMELVRILGTAPGGNKYLRLLASKADECLGVRIRGSLSDSEVGLSSWN
ncbi:uncharacterized protein LY89DRAFT_696272 [Mollisia scopiformis]|uniref:Zn(2)-C6 fungal-type domain-containing protein n=1 Tax=Mollisia scopiformis TaxID=149040 RepID=A0A194XF78_MOLSC|nr:uncharacterized protein LY89DRAFT_696272 [Mollisia scopiformis]KUJ18823.1 hypothetical protein LY89DRAFT_696272 [Mollisia scopiformis]